MEEHFYETLNKMQNLLLAFRLKMVFHSLTLKEVHLAKCLLLREIELAIRVQILDKAICISLCANAFGKGRNNFLFPSAMGK